MEVTFPLPPFDNPGPDEVSEEEIADDERIARRFGLGDLTRFEQFRKEKKSGNDETPSEKSVREDGQGD